MKTVIVREIYKVDTISKTNNNAWDILMDIVNKEGVDILFDFKGIEVAEPWGNTNFNKFIGDTRVHIKLYSSQKTVDTIDMACRLGGMKSGRFYNEEVVAPPRITKAELNIIALANQLQEYIVGDDKSAIFEIHRRFDQIGSVDTVAYINKAIDIYTESTGVKNIIIDTAGMFIQTNILEMFTGLMGEQYKKGVVVNVMSKDKDVMSKIRLYQHLALNRDISIEDKEEIKGLHKNTSGETVLKFESFNGNTFYTKEHWELENDGDELDRLDMEVLSIPVGDIGILDKFLGGKYHFLMPIQYDKNDHTTLYSIGQDGKVGHKKATIPMRIKLVLDDWGVQYDNCSLIHAISETIRILGKADNVK